MSSATDRVRRHRERVAAGLVTLQITVPEDETTITLKGHHQLDGVVEPTRADLERAVTRLLAVLHEALLQGA
jgi:hypothetical protein